MTGTAETGYIAAQNLDAEEAVLGAILLAGGLGPDPGRRAVDAIRETGLAADEFYRGSHAAIYRAACELADAGQPPDLICVGAELDRRGELDGVGGIVRIHALAALAPAVASAPHYASLIRASARTRALAAALGPIVDASRNGGVDPADARAAIEEARAALDSAGGTESPWRPVPLTEAVSDPAPHPDRFGGLIYPDALTLISGQPSVGKSLLLAAALGDEAVAGRTSLFLDFEDAASTLDGRLQAAGLTDDERSRVLYQRVSEPADPAAIQAMVAEHAPSLIAVDSYDAALAVYALETTNEDVRRFDRLVIQPLRATGAALLVADHVVKDREARGPYPIGGQSKLGLATVHLGLSPIEPLRRGAAGRLKIKTHKDRHGWLPAGAVFELRSHEVTGAISWTITVEEGSDSDDFRPTHLMERVSVYLEKQSGAVSQRTVERDVSGQGSALRRAVQVLLDEAYASEAAGSRGARMLTSLKPYREGSE